MLEMTVEKLIESVDSEQRQYLLPTIQRGFVWEEKRIEELFDSLMRGFPISSFLFWEVPDKDKNSFKFYAFEKDYNFYDDKPREFSNFGNLMPHRAVLDGQQRITSLYIGLKGSYIPKSSKPGKKSAADLKPKMLYLNLLKTNAEDDNGDADAGLDKLYEFKFLTEDEVKKVNENAADTQHFWFKVGDILNKEIFPKSTVIEKVLKKNELLMKKIDNIELPADILIMLWDSIRKDEVIEYHSTENKSLEDVLKIFVRINNGGKPVALSDLLVSLATVKLEHHADVTNDLKAIVKEVNDIGGKDYFNVSRDFVLRTFLVLCGEDSEDKKTIKFSVENFQNGNRMKKIDDEWNKMSKAIKLAVTLVHDFGFTQKHFASNNALIPLAHYIYLKDNKNYDADKSKMIHWFISATLGGVFSSRTDEKINNFRNILNKSHESFPLRKMLGVADGTTDEDLTKKLVDLIMTANYGYIKSAWMALSILYKNPAALAPKANFDIDHMFPKSKISALKDLASQGVLDKSMETELENYYNDFCDTLPNLQILPSAENKEKSSKYFSEWVKNQSDEYRDKNFVPDVDFKLANFKNFIDAREKLIREKLFDNLNSAFQKI